MIKQITYKLLLAVFAFFSIQSTSAQNNDQPYYSGELWVKINATKANEVAHQNRKVNLDSFISLIGNETAREYGLTTVEKPFYFSTNNKISAVFELHFNEAGREEAFARELEKLPFVNYAERIPVMRPSLEPNDLGPASGAGNQYSLWLIDAPQAWDINTGNTEVKVAVVDDAVLTTHPDLIPNLISGFDVADDDADPMPNEPAMSHGTHVAGIIGAAANNGEGVASIGFNLKILPVKSSDSPTVVSDAYAGVVWAAENDADVINMSWGGSGASQTGQDIINYAYDLGCVNVAAAGNDGVNQVFYPAGYDNVISVASTTSTDTKSGFSNYGNWIDISAPGSQILSTYIGANFLPEYANLSGTSMASPLVAGLAGLVLSVNTEMSQLQVENCIIDNADNIDVQNPGFLGELGAGRINAHQAVLCAQATVNAPPVAAISSETDVACPGSLVQFFGSSLGGLATGYNWSFPGGIPATSNDANPVVTYPEAGNYDVTLELTNDFGDDTNTEVNFIEISSNGVDVFFNENFETGTLESNGWELANSDGSISWELESVEGTVSGSQAVGINLFNYNQIGQRDGLMTPELDFSAHYNIQLDFQHAHRRFTSEFADSLIVYVSTDGGSTFPDRVLAIAEDGGGSFATGGIANQEFFPNNGSDWCFGGDLGSGCFSINLADYDGEENVVIKFESYNDGGNNIYLDNIQLSGNCFLVQAAPVADLSAFPITVCAGESVQFEDESVNVPSEYEWIFEGGFPGTSDMPAPEVTYSEPGSYDVTLLVSNEFGSDEITLENYIVVGESPALTVNTAEVTICEGESAELMASGAESYFWSPDVALSSTTDMAVQASPIASITYTVTGTSSGCAVSEEIEVNVLPAPAEPDVVAQDDVAFTVLEPAGISGHYNYTSTSTANGWGNPDIATVSIEADLVLADDGSASGELLCGPAENAVALNGNIAVVYRGGCEFGLKALNAQNAGALAVIVINNEPGTPIEMGPGADGASVTIPTIMVSDVTGEWIEDQVTAGDASAVLGQFNGDGFTICPGETMRLAAPGGEENYTWTDGTQSALIEIDEPGEYSVSIFNDNDCGASSESFTVNFYDVTQPVIEEDGEGNLFVADSDANSFQWYIDGEPIPGANENIVPIQGEGIYTIETTDENGCPAVSDSFEVINVGIAESTEGYSLRIFPVPARDVITVDFNGMTDPQFMEVFTTHGKRVFAQSIEARSNRIVVNVSGWSNGTYIVKVVGGKSSEISRILKVN